jgi:hypothetical protein
MGKLGPDPGATRKPPSWLVFADDALWVELAAALELSDIRRNQQLGERLWTPLTREVVNDKQLEQRYRAAGSSTCSSYGRSPTRASGSEAGSRATETWPTAKVRSLTLQKGRSGMSSMLG